MKVSRPIVALGVVALVVAYIALNVVTDRASRAQGASTHSSSGLGSSLFFELAKEIGDVEPRRLGRALMSDAELGGLDTLIIAGPKRAPSQAEERAIARWVDRGGRLIVSFHDESTWSAVSGLLREIGADLQATPRADFRNGEVTKLDGKWAPTEWGKVGETYELYGRMRFVDAGDTDACEDSLNVECFVRQVDLGGGDVIAFASVAPFANALLRRAGNRHVAARLAAAGGAMGFDEYHHFFSDKTLADLLLTPASTLPLLGLIATVLLFLASRKRWAAAETSATAAATRGYHEMNVDILGAQMASGPFAESAVRRQAAVLTQLYPHLRAAVGPSLAALSAADPVKSQKIARQLLALHAAELERMGRRRP